MKRKLKKQNKKESVKNHFAIRCLQRLGHIPIEANLIESIQKGRLSFYDRQSNRVTRWEWTDPVTGTVCLLPYDKERKQIITVLFKNLGDWWET